MSVDKATPRPQRVLITRRATDADERRSLRHEAELLATLRHPGVAEFISWSDDGDTSELMTRVGGTTTMSDLTAADTDTVAGIVAALAATCSDLHDIGIVHGRIEPHRVTIAPSGQPILTDFRSGGPVGSTPPESEPPMPPYCDPHAAAGVPLDPSIDVFCLGATLEHLLRHDVEGPGADRPVRRRLSRVARDAMAERAGHRPSAGELAGAILSAAPGAHLPDQPSSRRTARSGSLNRLLERPASQTARGESRRPRPVRGVAAAVGVVSIAVIALIVANRPGPSRAPADAAASATTPPTVVAQRVRPRTDPPQHLSPTPTGDLESSAPAAVITFEGVRYGIDAAEQHHAVGDWNCDGSETLALLDSSTGALTLFETWPGVGSVTASPVDHLVGAVDILAESSALEPCDELTVVFPDRRLTYDPTGAHS